MNYLDFELPIKELEDQLSECKILGEKSDVDIIDTCKKIQKKLIQKNENYFFTFSSK